MTRIETWAQRFDIPIVDAVELQRLMHLRHDQAVHVCNGDTTADALGLADLPGEIRVWADALDQGPLLPVSDAEHYAARAEFWASRGVTGSQYWKWSW